MTETLRVEDDETNLRLDVFLADRLPHLSRAHIQRLIGTHAVTGQRRARQVQLPDPARRRDHRRHPDRPAPGERPAGRHPAGHRLRRRRPDRHQQAQGPGRPPRARRGDGHAGQRPAGPLRRTCPASAARCAPASSTGWTRTRPACWSSPRTTSPTRACPGRSQERTAVRKYHALLWGRVPFKHAVIDAPIGRHPGDRKRMTVVEQGGMGPMGADLPQGAREAVTELRLLEHLAEFSWTEAILQTGRTHQIRVHCSFAGYPVVGDATYGGLRKVSADLLRGAPLADPERPARPPARPGPPRPLPPFDHPRTGQRLQFHAPLPDEIAELRGLPAPSVRSVRLL